MYKKNDQFGGNDSNSSSDDTDSEDNAEPNNISSDNEDDDDDDTYEEETSTFSESPRLESKNKVIILENTLIATAKTNLVIDAPSAITTAIANISTINISENILNNSNDAKSICNDTNRSSPYHQPQQQQQPQIQQKYAAIDMPIHDNATTIGDNNMSSNNENTITSEPINDGAITTITTTTTSSNKNNFHNSNTINNNNTTTTTNNNNRNIIPKKRKLHLNYDDENTTITNNINLTEMKQKSSMNASTKATVSPKSTNSRSKNPIVRIEKLNNDVVDSTTTMAEYIETFKSDDPSDIPVNNHIDISSSTFSRVKLPVKFGRPIFNHTTTWTKTTDDDVKCIDIADSDVDEEPLAFDTDDEVNDQDYKSNSSDSSSKSSSSDSDDTDVSIKMVDKNKKKKVLTRRHSSAAASVKLSSVAVAKKLKAQQSSMHKYFPLRQQNKNNHDNDDAADNSDDDNDTFTAVNDDINDDDDDVNELAESESDNNADDDEEEEDDDENDDNTNNVDANDELVKLLGKTNIEFRDRTMIKKPIDAIEVASVVIFCNKPPSTQVEYKRPCYVSKGMKNFKVKAYKPRLYDISLDKKAKIIPQHFCNVIIGNFTPTSDTEMVYSDTNLIPLTKIANSIMNEMKKMKTSNTNVDIRIVPSAHGDTLRELSLIKPWEHHLTRINNVNKYSPNYTVVYGAVPCFMSEFIQYILKYNYCNNNDNTKYMYDGDLELQAYCYWRLISQDLIEWKNDCKRTALKTLLENACTFICDEELQKKITKFAELHKPNITASCLLQIKVHYTLIMSSVNTLAVSNPERYEKGKLLWNTFMAKCNIHHYSCPHTMIEIASNMQSTKTQLMSQLKSFNLQDTEYEGDVKFTLNETKNLYENIIDRFQLRKDYRKLQKATSNAFTRLCKIFAYEIIKTGIVTNSTKITPYNVYNFKHLLTTHNLISPNIKLKMPTLENKYASMRNVITAEILSHYTVNSSCVSNPSIKYEVDALQVVFTTIAEVILTRHQLLVAMDRDDLFHLKDNIDVILAREINNIFDNDLFSSIKNIDTWTHTDDVDVDVYDEMTGKLERSFYQEYMSDLENRDSAVDCSDDEDDDMCYDETSEEHMAEMAELEEECRILKAIACKEKADLEKAPKVETITIDSDDDDASVINADDVNNNIQKHTQICEDDVGTMDAPVATPPPVRTKRKYTKRASRFFKTEIPVATVNPCIRECSQYQRVAPLSSRSKCTMCGYCTTHLCVRMPEDILVTSCENCTKRLSADFMSDEPKYDHQEIITRIHNKWRRPLAFDRTGEFISVENFDTSIKVNKAYNRSPTFKCVDKKKKKCGLEKNKISKKAANTTIKKANGMATAAIDSSRRVPKSNEFTLHSGNTDDTTTTAAAVVVVAAAAATTTTTTINNNTNAGGNNECDANVRAITTDMASNLKKNKAKKRKHSDDKDANTPFNNNNVNAKLPAIAAPNGNESQFKRMCYE